MTVDTTTIAITRETKKKLVEARLHKRETYDDTINRVLEAHKLVTK